MSPTLRADSLPVEPQGKPKNTRMGSLCLLQGIFPTQELNWGLLHYRQILYQRSYQKSPGYMEVNTKDGCELDAVTSGTQKKGRERSKEEIAIFFSRKVL